ncbi:MAG: hypothetical protein ACFB11_00615 [Paracoccaceae bacterium]
MSALAVIAAQKSTETSSQFVALVPRMGIRTHKHGVSQYASTQDAGLNWELKFADIAGSVAGIPSA